MSLARAFTTRMSKRDNTSTPPPIRTGSVRAAAKAIDRSIISPPVALLSTTNMLSYNAPDLPSASISKTLRKASSVSSNSSKASAEDSDGSSSTGSRSRDTYNTDASSVEGSPSTSPGVSKDAKSYFHSSTRTSVPRRSISTTDLRSRSSAAVDASPEIPQRAPSHSKRAHEQLARKRSLQQFPSNHTSTHSLSSITGREQRSSADMFAANKLFETPSAPTGGVHPFGRELEQLDEIAEEFGSAVRDVDREADMAVMKKKDLAKWCAGDYIAEIAPLFSVYSPFQAVPMVVAGGGGGWI